MDNKNLLNRALGLRFVIVVVIANIIGSGIFKKVAPMSAELHSSGWILIAWVLGGLITMLGALSNAEVAGMLADTGGDYVYYKKIYNRFFSFLFGWSIFAVIQTAGISSLAYVFSQSLNSLFPFPEIFSSLAEINFFGIFYPFANFSVKLTAIGLILILTYINTKGIKAGAMISYLILILISVGIFIIIFFGLTSEVSDITRSFDFSKSDNTTISISALFTAMLAAFWAYQGWSTVGYIGGEIVNPNKNIPRGIVLGLSGIIVIYFLINLTYLSILPANVLEEINKNGNQIAAIEVVKSFWGETGVIFISILILIATYSCTHATIYSSARPYYAMAQEGMFFSGFKKLNKHKVPVNSLFYQCIWACLLVLSGTFDQLTDMIIFAVFIYYGATAFGVFILRKKMPDVHRPYKVWGYPFVPAIFVLFCIGLFVNSFYTRPREAGMGLILMLLGIPFYLWFNKKKKLEEANKET